MRNSILNIKTHNFSSIMLFLFIIVLIISCLVTDKSISIIRFNNYVQIVIAYFAFCILLPYFSRHINVFIVIIAVLCIYESLLGIIQIIRYLNSEYYLFCCVGSFKNPGPYGGFLATCSSILVAYCFNVSNKQIKALNICALLLVAIVIPVTMSRAAFMGLGLSIFILLMDKEKYRILFLKHSFKIAISALLLATSLFFLKQGSANGRFHINRMSVKMICSNGPFGVGLGNYAGEYGKTQALYFGKKMNRETDDLDWTTIKERVRMTADCPTLAYNEFLQLGVEAGPLCMILLLSVIIITIIRALKYNNIWLYGLICFSIFACFSYPLEYLHFRLLLSFLLAICNLSNNTKLYMISNCITELGLIIVAIIISPRLKLELDSYKTVDDIKRWYNEGRFDYVVEDCDVISGPIYNSDFYFMYGKSLHEIGDYNKSDSILLIGSKRSSDPMFWNVMGNNSVAIGDYKKAEFCYKYSFQMLPNRLYPLVLLAQMYEKEGDYKKALEIIDKIEHFKPKVESERTEFLRVEIDKLKKTLLNTR